jgi:hypothetical protein
MPTLFDPIQFPLPLLQQLESLWFVSLEGKLIISALGGGSGLDRLSLIDDLPTQFEEFVRLAALVVVLKKSEHELKAFWIEPTYRIRIDRESEAIHDLILWLDEPAGIGTASL